MPAKGSKGNGKKKGKGKFKKTKSSTQDSTFECIFPREIVCKILSCLPVKSLLQFRCVCKPWRKLILKPNFITTHLEQQPKTLLLHSRHNESFDHLFSLYKSPESSVIDLGNPFLFYDVVVVGSCNGIVCLCNPPWGNGMALWNPATRQSTMLRLPKKNPLKGVHSFVSIGLAYDPQENDFLILSLLCFKQGVKLAPDEVELCSTKSSTWKSLKNEVGFHVQSVSCNVIIKGMPYWIAVIEDEHGLRNVLVYFDVDRKVFDKLPMPGIRAGVKGHLVDLKDSLGMLIWDDIDKGNLDVWLMDDEDGWSKTYNVALLVGFDRIVGCSWNSEIVVENENGVMLLVDPVTGSVKAELRVNDAKYGLSLFFNYSESLVHIKGMMAVKKEDTRFKLAREFLLRTGINFKVISTDFPQQLDLTI